MQVEQIHKVDFAQAVADHKVRFVTQEVDQKFQQAALKHAWNGSRDAKIVYSPLHGVGGFVVPDLLRAAGFSQVVEYAPEST
ncbi:MAG: phospho-sugar mutase, partial [Pirellula sp.]